MVRTRVQSDVDGGLRQFSSMFMLGSGVRRPSTCHILPVWHLYIIVYIYISAIQSKLLQYQALVVRRQDVHLPTHLKGPSMWRLRWFQHLIECESCALKHWKCYICTASRFLRCSSSDNSTVHQWTRHSLHMKHQPNSGLSAAANIGKTGAALHPAQTAFALFECAKGLYV